MREGAVAMNSGANDRGATEPPRDGTGTQAALGPTADSPTLRGALPTAIDPKAPADAAPDAATLVGEGSGAYLAVNVSVTGIVEARLRGRAAGRYQVEGEIGRG